MARTKRRKTRTHVRGDASAPTAVNIPKSFVVKHGEMGTSLTQLVRDVRKVMEPNTATRLKVSGTLQALYAQSYLIQCCFLKERSNNRLKDYIVMAPALKVSHLMAFSLTDLAPSLRIARLPQGPTFSFRVERYSLVKDVLHASRRPRSMNLEYLSAPLVSHCFFTRNHTISELIHWFSLSWHPFLLGPKPPHTFPSS